MTAIEQMTVRFWIDIIYPDKNAALEYEKTKRFFLKLQTADNRRVFNFNLHCNFNCIPLPLKQ